MIKKKTILAFFLALIFIVTGCGKKEKIAENDKLREAIESSENIEKEISKEKKPKKSKIGEPYEIGVTPDDYNMDYDTSRLLTLEDKKSKYYPKDGVRGLYFNSGSINNLEVYGRIIGLIEESNLNSVVIDVKDDWGNITVNFDTDNEDIQYANTKLIDAKSLIDDLHSRGIYVIGRITTFKDSVITKIHPEWGFTKEDGSLWANGREEVFMNPFLREVQDYNIEIGELAAEAGFDEIQYDYVRFAEGFETFGDSLQYSRGEFENKAMDEGDKRVEAITGFVRRARESISAYGLPVAVDVFGYALQAGRASGIGQDFSEMSNEADIMCSMIYPSHWGPYSFDIEKPDLEPYELVKRYLKEEQEVFKNLDHTPQSRPWIQDFTASWIGEGNWMEYDADAVQAQVDAIYESGQREYLIWNATSTYSEGVDY
ncbi:putative glycoside hydrolase [uncultured Anaerococcus sp.]|uniref:putative glycoside hydrolase n=1 Tax=uncultured Anaerococcus sp. TaxID=293428 RepID=UPI002637058B|nr:putative glycoside hydrolase [uncultured Anaerococcus sp.]